MPLPPLVDPVDALDPDELRRTARQVRLPELGEVGQRRLAAARVAVVGAGGLGSPALLALAAAGVGTIGIIDDDVVDVTNLHRQVVHGTGDVGRPKVDSAAERLAALAPRLVVQRHPVHLTDANARDVLDGYDLVLDGSDRFETRYIVSDACADLGIPVVWAAVLGFDAQVSVFWSRPPVGDGRVGAVEGVTLRDLYPVEPEGGVPTCADVGVLGSLCMQAGALMATEAIKLITGVGEPLLGRVLVIDGLRARQREVGLRPAAAPQRSDVSQSSTSMTDAAPAPPPIGHVSAGELRQRLDEVTVLDVREPSERAERAIAGSLHTPLGTVLAGDRTGLDRDRAIVVHCAIGPRAERAAAVLAAEGYRVSVLDGGMRAWAVVEATS
ncbi:molybdopterin-synthase adenylyltransferase [Agromyces intestinalis]|uniref:Molybdopterin-synthase adenylyltransferase n=1 Tax=Agromyces intestinalis TaxID=2592652 RepID=A0A5C1YFZ7_9MICO|nr:ThiF family adenylyltransferase [Agromyces intestinalis]QEO13702.1 molybdopterin-synthase adenylyltransferase [Agromyces intestinalis]